MTFGTRLMCAASVVPLLTVVVRGLTLEPSYPNIDQLIAEAVKRKP